MDRRAFIGALTAGAFATASRAAAAQQAGRVRHVGILTAGVLPKTIPPAWVDELRERGWVEGQNLIFDRRGGDGNSERVPALAAELVQMKLDVILSFGAVAGVALKNATTTIPIVATTGDPVRFGLVSNLSHPGGNITGLSLIAPELAAKRLELIRQLLPEATLIGELVDPANTYWQRVRPDYEQAFRAMRMPRRSHDLREPRTDRPPGEAVLAADDGGGPTECRSGDADVLRTEHSSHGSDSCALRRQDSSRSKAGRSAHRAAHPVRIGRQPKDRQGARYHHPTIVAAAR